MPKIQTSLRIEEKTFKEAKEILSSLGMNFTEAVNIFVSMVVQERGLPFDVKIHEYPAISEEEAKAKVKKSIENITPKSGIASKKFFDDLLSE